MEDKYLILVGAIVVLAFAAGYFAHTVGQIVVSADDKLTSSISAVDKIVPIFPLSQDLAEAIVTKEEDGDTVELQDGQRVRLLGLNTPEKAQPCYQEATERLSKLVLNKKIQLEMDKTDKDKYGRLLRHIYADDQNVGIILLKGGYANVFFISPDLKYKEEFESAKNYAKKQQLCMWAVSDYEKCIGISYFKYNAEDNDRENLNGEYVSFKNSCDFAISMKGWSVKDDATHMYKFPDFVLASHQTVTLNTGSGTDSVDNLYWGQNLPVWNNDVDTLYMWDSEGKLILEYGY